MFFPEAETDRGMGIKDREVGTEEEAVLVIRG